MIKVLVAINPDGSVRMALSDTEDVVVIVDRLSVNIDEDDEDDPPYILEAHWQPTFVENKWVEAEEYV